MKNHAIYGCLLLCLGVPAAGCGKSTQAKGTATTSPPPLEVHVAKPQPRTITRSIAVPGVIQAYEQTAIYSKIPGYVLSWIVDLGNHVKKDQLMATLLVPELVEQHREKLSQLAEDRAAVEQAKQAVAIAQRNVEVAASEIEEAQADVERYQAQTQRWHSEYLRLKELAKANAVDIRVVQEAEEHYRAEQSSERASTVKVTTKQTQKLAAAAQVDKAKADVAATQATVQVGEATVARYAALLAYTRITAPYDAIVTARNVSVGDLVRPGSGEEGTSGGLLGSTSKATPLFVLARMDKLMFVVGVPELDAGNVNVGTPVNIQVQSLGIPEVETQVSRISWSISAETRTLTAQIDLPNPKQQLMPGMYASGTLKFQRSDVLAVPATAIVASGNHRTCFFVVDHHAVQQEVEVGLSDDNWAQVMRKKAHSGHDQGKWLPITPDDQIIARDVSQVTDGARVEIAQDHDTGTDHGDAGSSQRASSHSDSSGNGSR